MAPAGSSPPRAEVLAGTADPPVHPFHRPGLLVRAAPFAAIAVVAEASLALPPGPGSAWAVLASVLLLAAVAAAFLLPWPRLPGWLPVLVPLAYTGSVLALILAAGVTSGVGIVILIPLLWTALFHRMWESACVVLAIVAVEVILSLTPVFAGDAVIARRVILWASLGAVISIATHGLRDRIRHSQRQAAQLQDRLRELTVLEDRDRIAADLQDSVVQRIFAVSLDLVGAAALSREPDVRHRVESAVAALDEVLRIIRNTIFGLGQRRKDRGFREEILELCDQLSPAPEVSFTGPVDLGLLPGTGCQLLGILREAVSLIGRHSAPARIAITVTENSCVTVIEATPLPRSVADHAPVREFAQLRDRATAAGMHIAIEPVPGATRFAWHIPLDTVTR